MLTFSPLELSAVVVALTLTGYLYRSRQTAKYPLPPGPKKLPLVGNLFDLPSTYAWKTWAEWGRTYNSDILHLDAAGKSIIILNSYAAASEILEQRSAIYSSRPTSIMLSELSGFGYQFGLMPYGERWRARRRLFKKYFNPSNAGIYEFQEDKYLHRFLHQLLERPADIVRLLDVMIGSISLSMTYGVDILPENDPNMQIARIAAQTIKDSLTAGSAIVDMVPMLKYLPAWFPGAGFQRVAANSRMHASRLRDGLFRDAHSKWSTRGMLIPSFISLCLDDCPDENNEEQMAQIKDVAGNVYLGSHDTTTATLKTFILAMTCYPEIQKRAQQELDDVVGLDRLPTHEDAPHLPYFSALLKEVIRWQPIVPSGVAHQSTAPDVYKGYYIPEDTMVMSNIWQVWAMLNDESDYPEPREFKPERFLNSDGQLKGSGEVRDPVDIAFGFGRRICPGMHIGLSVSWITAASILTLFKFEKALDANGHPIEPSCEYTSGAVSHPLPFDCSIKPRSRKAVNLIQEIKEAVGNNE